MGTCMSSEINKSNKPAKQAKIERQTSHKITYKKK
jgi:hypothetical protein